MLGEYDELSESQALWQQVCTIDNANEHFRWQLAVVSERLESQKEIAGREKEVV